MGVGRLVRKSSSRVFTWSGASSCGQWPMPSIRSYRHGASTKAAVPVSACSVMARSSVLQIPMVGAWMGGSSVGGRISDSGGRIARYTARLAVRAAGSRRCAMTESMSGCRLQLRRLAKSSAASQCSAMPGNWNSSMYHDFSRCSQPAAANAAGWPTDRQVRLATRSGAKAASTAPIAPPQSWPTTWAWGAPRTSRSPMRSLTMLDDSVARDGVGLVGVTESAKVGRDGSVPGLAERGDLVAPDLVACRASRGVGGRARRRRGPLPRGLFR